MTKMCAVAASLALVACGGGKKTDHGDHGGSGSGSGTGSGSGSVGAPGSAAAADDSSYGSDGSSGMNGSAAMQAPMTPAARAKAYDDCWSLWNAGRFDAYANCYALDAKVEAPGSGQPVADSRAKILDQVKAEHAAIPDQHGDVGLELVSGNTIIAVARIRGTMGGKPTTIDSGVVTDFDDRGMITHEQAFLDASALDAQRQGKQPVPAQVPGTADHQVIIGKDDDTEKANLATVRQLVEAMDKRDAGAIGKLLGEHATWDENAEHTTRAELMAQLPKIWKALPDMHVELGRTWTAGPYVAAESTVSFTRGGKTARVPAIGIYQVAQGTVTSFRAFYQN